MSQVISVRQPAADASVGATLKNALTAALLTAVLTLSLIHI